MKILLVSATAAEISPILERKTSEFPDLSILITGVGMLAAGIHITKAIAVNPPDLVLQAGIAGAYNLEVPLASALLIDREYLGDLGVFESGTWKDLFDLKLQSSDDAPFTNRALVNPHAKKFNVLNLPVVSGVTVNEITTDTIRINQVKQKYNPGIESMEGAALHYAGIAANLPFLQIRTVSNYIGERDKSKWALRDSVTQLNKTVVSFLESFK